MKKGESKVLQGGENQTVIKAAWLPPKKNPAWKSWGLQQPIWAISAAVGCSGSPNFPPWMDIAIGQPFPIRRHYRPLACDWITTDEHIAGTLKSNERPVINAITRIPKELMMMSHLEWSVEGFIIDDSLVARLKTLGLEGGRGWHRWRREVSRSDDTRRSRVNTLWRVRLMRNSVSWRNTWEIEVSWKDTLGIPL